MLRAGGHHAVGFVGTLGGQVVGHDADIGHVPGDHQGLLALQLQGGVHARQETLAGRFLIAAGAVDLPREEQAADAQTLQRGAQLPAIDAIVLDGIGQAGQFAAAQAGNGAVHLPLHVLRQGGGHALHIPFPALPALRLQKDLMPVLVGKLHDLILNAGAIPGSHAVDLARIQRRPVQIAADDLVGLRGGPGEVALVSVVQFTIRHEGEGNHRLVAGLGRHFVKVDGAHVHTGRGAGLEPAQLKPQIGQAAGKAGSVHQPLGAALLLVFANDDAALEIHAAGHHHRLAGNALPGHGGHRPHAAILHLNGGRLALADNQPLLAHQRLAHPVLIGLLVRLRPQAVYRRPLAQIQHPALQKGVVNGATHLAAQCVQLPHQMPLGRAADHRVAGHEGNAVHVQCQQHRVHPHARGRQRRLTPRMAAADHHNIRHKHPPYHITIHYSTTTPE